MFATEPNKLSKKKLIELRKKIIGFGKIKIGFLDAHSMSSNTVAENQGVCLFAFPHIPAQNLKHSAIFRNV